MIALIVFVVLVAGLIWLMQNAPRGFQDAEQFHYDNSPVSSPTEPAGGKFDCSFRDYCSNQCVIRHFCLQKRASWQEQTCYRFKRESAALW